MRNHGLVDRDQAYTDGGKKAAHEQEHAHRLTMETHGEQNGAGFQAAKEEQERPTQTPTSGDGARAPSPDRQPLNTDLSEAVAEENEEQVNLDVGREVVGYQAGLPSHEEQVDDSAGGNEIDSSRGEGSEESEVEENRATRRRKGEWIAVSRKKTRTKTTTTKTTTKTNDTTTITTVTETTTKVSRKRFERR
ncbi:hypothetical protein K4K61_012219 [Colletotrichum sp. SAR11_59]|nr:hypothetical protein K4K61_012219 [Colletotrichum sp. SAR11_59]